MEGSRLTRLARGPLFPNPAGTGAVVALVPRPWEHMAAESAFFQGAAVRSEGLSQPAGTGTRGGMGSEHPLPLGKGRGEGLGVGFPPAIRPLEAVAEARQSRGRNSVLVPARGAWERRLRAPLTPVPTKPAGASASPAHPVLVRDRRGIVTRMVRGLVQSTQSASSPRPGPGGKRTLPPPLLRTDSRPGLLSRSVTTGAALPVRRGPTPSQRGRVLATQVDSSTGGMGSALAPVPSQRAVRSGDEADTAARDSEQSLTPALSRRERGLTTEVHSSMGGMDRALTPVPSQRAVRSGAEADTAARDSEKPLTLVLAQRERVLASQASRGTGDTGGTVARVSAQRAEGRGVEPDTEARDPAQFPTPVLPQRERELAAQVHPVAGDIGRALSPIVPEPASRAPPAARGFSLSIGRLEIRTRPPSLQSAPTPLLSRSHQIDPGLGPGLVRLGSTPW